MSIPSKWIQAFNTETKMLSCFQQPKLFKMGEKSTNRTLRISDSVVMILSQEHEVVAVTTLASDEKSLTFVATANGRTSGWDKTL
jgi:hypothetical protein